PYELGHAILAYDTQTLTIVNNTISQCDAGISYADSVNATVRIINNIVGTLNQTTHDVYMGQQAAPVSTLDYAVFKPTARIKWGASSPVRNVAQFKAAFPSQCTVCFEADPQFVSPTAFQAGEPGRT